MKRLAAVDVYTKPLSKERPRTGRGGHVYTPKRTQEYKAVIRAAAIGALEDGYKIPTGPVKVVVDTVNDVPKSWNAEQRWLALTFQTYPNKGDLDNRVKAVLDALNGVYYVDDVQIVMLEASMRYGTADLVSVAVYEVPTNGSRDETDNNGGARMGR